MDLDDVRYAFPLLGNAQKRTRRMAKKRAKFVIKRDRKGEYRIALISANGETVMVSESYTRKRDAVRAQADIGTAFLSAIGIVKIS